MIAPPRRLFLALGRRSALAAVTALAVCVSPWVGAGCGSAHDKRAAEASPPPQAAPESKPAGDPEAAEFCANYFNVYCEHSRDDDGKLVESLYGELPTADQRQLREECEAEFVGAAPAQREAMTACLGCVTECSATKSCLHGADLCGSASLH
jgi:hypothetical protein